MNKPRLFVPRWNKPRSKFSAMMLTALALSVFAGSALADVQLKKQVITYTNTEDFPNASESNLTTEYEYNKDGFVTKHTNWTGDAEKTEWTTTFKYDGSIPAQEMWEKRILTANYAEEPIVSYVQNFTDDSGKITSQLSLNPTEGGDYTHIAYLTTFRYDSDGTPIVTGSDCYTANFQKDPVAYTLGNLVYSHKYVWCEGADGYFQEVYEPSFERKAYPDSVCSTRWTDDTRSDLKEYRVDFYADGEKTGYKWCERSSYDGEYRWYGSREPLVTVDSVARCITTITFNLDSETGEWVNGSKTEKSFNCAEPGFTTFSYSYYWNKEQSEWRLSQDQSFDYVWDSYNKIKETRKHSDNSLVSETKYDNDLNLMGSINRISDSMYYILDQNRPAQMAYVTYYTSSHQYARKLRLDFKKHYIYPEVREWLNGEWVMPTQSFTLKNYERLVNHPASYDTQMAEVTWNTQSDRPKTENYYFIADFDGKRHTIKTRFWNDGDLGFTCRDGDYELTEDCSIKKVTDHIYGVTLKKWPKYSKASTTYSEYDVRRSLLHRYSYDESTKNHVYSYTDFLKKEDYNWSTYNDTSYTYDPKYVRETDQYTATLIKKLQKDDTEYKMHYTLHPETFEWVLVKEESIEYADRPDWIHYELPSNISFSWNNSPNYYHTKGELNYVYPKTVGSYEADKVRDVTSIIKEYDETTGELKTTTESYVVYTDDDYVCERKQVSVSNGDETSTRERYEKNGAGYPTAIYKPDYAGEKINKYYYNNHNLLVRAEVCASPDYVITFSYVGESDEIDTDAIAEVKDNANLRFFVNNRVLRTVDVPEFTLYSIDGRKVAVATDGEATVSNAGVYILVAGDKRVKVRIP